MKKYLRAIDQRFQHRKVIRVSSKCVSARVLIDERQGISESKEKCIVKLFFDLSDGRSW